MPIIEKLKGLQESSNDSLTRSLVDLQNTILASTASFEEMGLRELKELARRFCRELPDPPPGDPSLTEDLYLEALIALCCRSLREWFQHPSSSPAQRRSGSGDRCRRLLLLWHWLRGQFSYKLKPQDREDSRWAWHISERKSNPVWAWPQEVQRDEESLTAACDLETLLQPIEAASGRCYPVYFPTAGDNVILAARLTALAPGADWAADWPNLVIAPWSVLTLAQDNMEHLREVLKAMPELHLVSRAEHPQPLRFLIEFLPAHPHLVPRGLLISGNSLDLAVCLAAWAVTKKRNLRRLCLTGKVETNGKIGKIEGLEAPDGKIAALKRFTETIRQSVVLIVPKVNDPQWYVSALRDNEFITVNGRNRDRAEVEPETLNDLLGRREMLNLMTDCFDDYREAVGNWQPASGEASRIADQAARAAFLEHQAAHRPTCPEFNEDPFPFAAGIVRSLVGLIAGCEQDDPGFAAATPVPLLLPLEQCSDREDDFDRKLVEALLAGIAHWRDRHGLHFSADDFFRNLLNNERDKLWLVVYCPKSLEMLSYDDLKKRLDQLTTHLNRRSDHLILVASDYHHYLMLGQHLKLEDSARDAVPAS